MLVLLPVGLPFLSSPSRVLSVPCRHDSLPPTCPHLHFSWASITRAFSFIIECGTCRASAKTLLIQSHLVKESIMLSTCREKSPAMEAARSINNVLGLGIANERTLQWWFKKFCKGDESPEDENHSGWPLEVDNDQLRGSPKLILLQLLENFLRNSTILQSFNIWSRLERWIS